MTGWGELPIEILNIIAVYLGGLKSAADNHSLAQFALTCRGWRIPAQSILFSDIRLNNQKDFEKICVVIRGNMSIGNWVKTLFYQPTSNGLSYQSLITLDDLFPFLESIHILGKRIDTPYLFIYKALTENNSFKNLKVMLPPPWNRKEEEEYYFKCLHLMKERVTSMCLFDDDNTKDKCLYTLLCDNLYQFSNLRHVHIVNSGVENESNLRKVTEYIESLTKNTYLCSLNLPLYYGIHSFDTELNTIQPAIYLKNVSAEIYAPSGFTVPKDDFLLYFMRKAPNLTSLRLINSSDELEYNTFPPIIDTTLQSTDIINRFFSYAVNIPDCTVKNAILTSENTAQVVQALYKLTTVSKTRILPMHLEIGCISSHARQENTSVKALISYYNDNSTTTTAITTDYKIRKVKVCFDRKSVVFQDQLLEILKSVGQFLYTMTLCLESMDNFLFAVGYVVKYCTKLNELNIRCKNPVNDNNIGRRGISFNSNDSIRKLVVSQWVPTKKQFADLSSYLPCLDTLIIDYCLEQREITEKRFFCITMLDHAFKYLEITMKSDSLPNNNQFKGVLIALYANQKCRKFLLVNEGDQTNSNHQFKLFKTCSEINSRIDYIKRSGIVHVTIHCTYVEKFTLKFDGTKDNGVVGRLSVDVHVSDDVEQDCFFPFNYTVVKESTI